MLFTSTDRNEDVRYKYQQIYQSIKKQILEGSLRSNEKLLSKRKFAKQLGVSVNSVTNAYEQLLAEGYIYAIERKGYYVERITKFTKQKNLFNKKLPDDLKEQFYDKKEWLSLSHMSTDISKFPFDMWIKSKQKAIANHKTELSKIGDPFGPYLVRKTIAQLIRLNRGVVCEPEQIIIGSGTQLLIQKLIHTLHNNTVIAIENPGYSRFYNLLKQMKLDVRPIQLNKTGIDVKKINSSEARVVIVTPSHQFPTGKIMPISKRNELLNWAMQLANRYIIEDDYDSEFKYKTDNIPSLQSLDHAYRVIYAGTFSKTLLPGLRISYMVLPPELLRVYKKQYANLIHSSNTLSLYTLHYFIQDGEYEKHLKRMNNHYELKRKMLIEKLQKCFGTSIYIEDVPAGLHFFVTFQTTKSYKEIEEAARRKKLEIYTLRRFILKHINEIKHERSLVIGFASIDIEDMDEAVERLRIIFSE